MLAQSYGSKCAIQGDTTFFVYRILKLHVKSLEDRLLFGTQIADHFKVKKHFFWCFDRSGVT